MHTMDSGRILPRKALVYWNSHRKCFSVKYAGEKVQHVDRLWMEDCTFKVRESGRQKVLQTKRKNVHAFIKGIVHLSYPTGLRRTNEQIKYNPYRHERFVLDRGGQEYVIKSCKWLEFLDGKVYYAHQ